MRKVMEVLFQGANKVVEVTYDDSDFVAYMGEGEGEGIRMVPEYSGLWKACLAQTIRIADKDERHGIR